ncbi:LutC/YkgG family protein [Nocardiopsis coralliicola]
MGSGDAAREEILARVRQAAVVAGEAADAGPDSGAAGSQAGGGPSDAGFAEPAEGGGRGRPLEELFGERLAAVGVGVQHVSGVDDLPRVIASALWARGVRRVAVPAGLPARWLSDLDGVWAMRDDPPRAPLSVRALDGVGASVTRCALAVADTGTLVFDGGVGQGPRRLAALPPYHVCVVESGQVVADMAAALAALDPARPTTWLTGTTESTAVDGVPAGPVHGPRRIDVVLVD